MKSYKVHANKNVVGILNLLKEKKNFQIKIEHDDAMVKDEAQVEVPTDPDEEIVIIKANTSLWSAAMGCIIVPAPDEEG